jgi:hypothetical protein
MTTVRHYGETAMSYFHCYRPHRFNAAALKTLEQANHVIGEMGAQGYTLTLRQLYYQFVRRNWIANSEKEYKRLGRIMTDGREGGVVDWFAIEDRGRKAHGPYVEEDPASAVAGVETNLQFDRWADQDAYIEVWVEKQALEGVVARPCNRLYTRYMACKGYLSASEAWRAGLRFAEAISSGKSPVLIHLADHDPSGLDMTDDNAQRIRLFAEDHGVEVRRIALNMDQVRQYNPPPNPAKTTDSRYAKYIGRFGRESWELDALEPSVLEKLISDEINSFIDPDPWNDVAEREADARRPLTALSRNWTKVQSFLDSEGLID